MTHKDYLSKVGMEIKIARIRKGLSRQQVSELTGMHQLTIGKVERGMKNAQILTFKRIADAIGIEMKEFF